MKSKSSWFDGSWFAEEITPKKPSTTTTPLPLTTAPSNWFQTLLDSEDGDGAYISNDYTMSKYQIKSNSRNNSLDYVRCNM